MTINIRPYQETDFDALQEMITETWYAGNYKLDPDATNTFSALDTNLRLHDSSFGLTAEEDGKVLGVFLGNIKNQEKTLKENIQIDFEDVSTLAIDDNPVKRDVLTQLTNEIRANRYLDEHHGSQPDAVIELFILSPAARGKGIGGKLWENGLQVFADHDVKDYVLHTDSDCDYSFYDHKGLTPDKSYSYSTDPKYKYFLYAGEIK